MPWSMPRGGPSPSSSRPARPMTAEARSICWTVWARETSCSLTAPTTPTLCVRRSRNAAPGRASNQCPDASTLRLSVPFFIVTETSSSASSTNSSTSAPSPRDTKNTPTTTSHSSSSLPSEYGCDLMSLCLRLRSQRQRTGQGHAGKSLEASLGRGQGRGEWMVCHPLFLLGGGHGSPGLGQPHHRSAAWRCGLPGCRTNASSHLHDRLCPPGSRRLARPRQPDEGARRGSLWHHLPNDQ